MSKFNDVKKDYIETIGGMIKVKNHLVDRANNPIEAGNLLELSHMINILYERLGKLSYFEYHPANIKDEVSILYNKFLEDFCGSLNEFEVNK